MNMNIRVRSPLTALKNLLLFLPLITLWACGENVAGVEGAIVDNPDNVNKFQQLLMIVKVTDPAGRHLVLEQIDSVKLKINGMNWGAFPSAPIDLTGIETTVSGNFLATDDEIGYLVVAKYTIAVDGLVTAGDFASYLHNRLRLAPGDYVAEIAEIYFRDTANNPVSVRPRLYRSFTIEENVASLYLGEIEASIK